MIAPCPVPPRGHQPPAVGAVGEAVGVEVADRRRDRVEHGRPAAAAHRVRDARCPAEGAGD